MVELLVKAVTIHSNDVKMTFYEGGVQSLAIATGGPIPSQMRGKSIQGFMHIADWYTTFCTQAGVDSRPGRFPVNGMDVWPVITDETDKTLHEKKMLGYNFTRDIGNPSQGALFTGNYRINCGSTQRLSQEYDDVMWSPIDYSCNQGPVCDDCDLYCLFDIVNDPREEKNLSKRNLHFSRTCSINRTNMHLRQSKCRIKNIMINAH